MALIINGNGVGTTQAEPGHVSFTLLSELLRITVGHLQTEHYAAT